jgi:hypothetical protein
MKKENIELKTETIIKKRGAYRITYAIRTTKAGRKFARRIAVQFIGKAVA